MVQLWMVLIGVLWAGFFLLEGFDFGVGILAPFLTKEESGRSVALRSIGPFWDGNEVWLLVAGGATFAAFPEWYASMFSGLYLPLFLILFGLILRGICIEYRRKFDTARSGVWCDWGICVGSLLPAVLFGVAFADIVGGLNMNSHHEVTSTLWDELNPYGLLGGLTTLVLFLFHGAVFLTLKTEGEIRTKAATAGRQIAPVAIVIGASFLVTTQFVRGSVSSAVIGVVMALTLICAAALHRRAAERKAFIASGVTVALAPAFLFAALWPNVMPARNNSAWSLTMHNASSSHHTLVVMTTVAFIFVPIVLAYTTFTYWVFRARVSESSVGHAPSLPRARTTANDVYRGSGG